LTATITQRFARFASEIDELAAPELVRDAVGLHLLDALGCGLAAVGLDVVPYAGAAVSAAETGPAAALGVAELVPAATAALVNGITIHALDFDDTHPGSIAHVSAVVVPAALAAGQAVGASGAQLGAALLAGNEVACRIGRPAGDAFHARGFHATAICGVFGATVAVAKLLELDEQGMVAALGIAGSMAAGVMAYLIDGSDTKRLHPGWMAHAAHVAVSLARNGATGPAAVLEGRNGVYGAFIDRHDVEVEQVTGDLGSTWETLRIAFKPYPACHFVHAPLDALDQLRHQHRFTSDAIERITVFSPAAGIELVGSPVERKRRPQTPYEGKFSAPFAVAALLCTGVVEAATFTGPLLVDPSILALADRVDCAEREYDTFPSSLPGGVRVELAGGGELERHVLHQRGGKENPMGSDEIVAKFRTNASGALPTDDTSRLERFALALTDHGDLEPLGLIRRSHAPAPARDGGVLGHLGAGL
jgi:2-methylcitrate dehydratase PrpD